MLSLQKIPIRRLANLRHVFASVIFQRSALSLFVVISLLSLTRCARQTTIRLSGSEIEFEYVQRDSSILRGSGRSSNQ